MSFDMQLPETNVLSAFLNSKAVNTYGFCMFFCESIEKHGVLMNFHQKVNESTVFSNQLCFVC